MDLATRQRLSAIAHTGSLMWGPISAPTIDSVMDRLAKLGVGSVTSVVDLGCGPAELSRRIAQNLGARVLAIDASPFAIEEARRRLAGSPAMDRVDLRLGDVHELEAGGDYDLALCIGPGWDAGGWQALSEWAARFVRTEGLVVIGEGAWRSQPSPDALERLGMAAGDYVISDQIEEAVRAGEVDPLWIRLVARDEWDAYGATYRAALASFARDHPDDPIAPAAAERAGPGWAEFELLHEVLDFGLVIGRPWRAEYDR